MADYHPVYSGTQLTYFCLYTQRITQTGSKPRAGHRCGRRCWGGPEGQVPLEQQRDKPLPAQAGSITHHSAERQRQERVRIGCPSMSGGFVRVCVSPSFQTLTPSHPCLFTSPLTTVSSVSPPLTAPDTCSSSHSRIRSPNLSSHLSTLLSGLL